MKTVIKFDGLFSDMLRENGNDVEAVVNACQSEANSAQGKDSGAKRGDFRGGQSYKADGTLMIKPVKFTENVRVEYEIAPIKGSVPVPAEIVKFHDSLCRHWKATGRPNGKLSPDMLPSHLALWLAVKCRAEAKGKAKDAAKATDATEAAEVGKSRIGNGSAVVPAVASK